jgi:hypothetical protein
LSSWIWKRIDVLGDPRRVQRVRDNSEAHIANASTFLGLEYERAAILDLESGVVAEIVGCRSPRVCNPARGTY